MSTPLTESQLLFRLQDFYGAEQDASKIGDHEFAQECADIVSVIREVQAWRQASANPVAWRCDSGSIANQRVVTVSSVVADSWMEKGMEVTPLYIKPQPRPIVPTFDEWLESRGSKPLGWVRDVMRESYEACRAAMLNGDKS